MIKTITIIRATVFAGAAVEPGTVLDVDDANQGAARYLITHGKAVEGEAAQKKPKSNKAVTAAQIETK